MSHRLLLEGHGESGAVAVVTAITLTILVLMAALVIDLGFMRADRVDSKAVADMAAAAGAVAYDPEAPGSMRAACVDAIAFVEANLRDFEAGDPLGPCVVFPEDAVCSPAIEPITAVFAHGPYTVRITSPVPDADEVADDFDYMEGMNHGETYDGLYCDRIGVRISRDRDFLLARVAGFVGGETTQSSVARWAAGGDEELFASLVVLEEQGCAALRNSGQDQGNLIVGSAEVDGEFFAGTITVDTVPDDGCTGGGNWSNRVIAVQNNNQALIRADGRIFAYGLNGYASPRIYWDTVVKTDPETTSGLYPRPTVGITITRAPVDYRFNCLDNYPEDEPWSPNWSDAVGIRLEECKAEDPPPPYLYHLWDELHDFTRTDADASGDWQVFPDDVVGGTCRGSGASGTLTGSKWYIDCPSSVGQAFSPEGLTFQDVEYVVSRNRIELGGGEGNHLTIEGDTGKGAVLFVQNGRIAKSGQARLYLVDTFVYLENGHIDFGGNSPDDAGLNHDDCTAGDDPFGVCWHAPTIDMDGCDDYTEGELPVAACFAPLALWSNATTLHDLGGQVAFDISGSYFTPNARPFRLSGQSEQNFTRAQFFTAQLSLTGKAPVLLAPNPDTNLPITLPGIALIR